MKVAIVMGSKSDWPPMSKAAKTLKDLGIEFEVRVRSAHRTPLALEQFVDDSEADVFIAAAGGAAHLAGAIAAKTVAPVIGVPIANTLQGLDALLSTCQMPPGVPVATVGLDNGTNAALLAAQIIAVSDEEVRSKLNDYRVAAAKKVFEADDEIAVLMQQAV